VGANKKQELIILVFYFIRRIKDKLRVGRFFAIIIVSGNHHPLTKKTMSKHKITLEYLARNISAVIGLVLIWRGIWYILDGFDRLIFGDSHIWTSLGGVIVGLIVLYLPDKNLKEIERL
jgi:hypothetical protein